MKLKDDKKILLKLLDVENEKFQGYGELQLVYGRIPVIEYKDSKPQGQNQLVAETTSPGTVQKYFLAEIESGLFNDICNYVFFGNADKANLLKVHFTIPELAPYFINELNYRLDKDGNLSGNLTIPSLESNILIDDSPIKITIHQGYNLKKFDSNNGFGFTNIIYVSFELSNPISFEEIKKLMYQTTSLFTWITVDEIEVSDGENVGCLYIPSVKNTATYDTSNENSFMDSCTLRNNFDDICRHYFVKNKSMFVDIWSRTIPLFYFTGVLEYELMLYASVLDKYFSYQVNMLSLDVTNPIGKYEEFIAKLEQHLHDDIELQDMIANAGVKTSGDCFRVKEMFPNTILTTFHKKAKAYLGHIGNFCTEVFINYDQLHKIKQIRDRAAHGEIEKCSTDEVVELLWRVKILSMYLIYRDLGINDEIFLKMLYRTFHPIKLNCAIDDYKLEIKLGCATSITLSSRHFSDYESQTSHIRVFWKRGEQWTYDAEMSKSSSDYFFSVENFGKDKEFRSYNEFVQNQLAPKDKNFKVKFCGNAYLVNKTTLIRMHSAVIIEKIN